jgi:hypothetical protein
MPDALKPVLVLLAGLVAFVGALAYFMAADPGNGPASAPVAHSEPPPATAPGEKEEKQPETLQAAPEVDPQLTRANSDKTREGMNESDLTRLKMPERPDPPGMTRRNFEKIQNGMTEDEVVALLGRFGGSATREGTMNGNPFHIRTLSWHQTNQDERLTITVTLSKHKVSGKNWKWIGPIKK